MEKNEKNSIRKREFGTARLLKLQSLKWIEEDGSMPLCQAARMTNRWERWSSIILSLVLERYLQGLMSSLNTCRFLKPRDYILGNSPQTKVGTAFLLTQSTPPFCKCKSAWLSQEEWFMVWLLPGPLCTSHKFEGWTHVGQVWKYNTCLWRSGWTLPSPSVPSILPHIPTFSIPPSFSPFSSLSFLPFSPPLHSFPFSSGQRSESFGPASGFNWLAV